ncbi:G-protein coupled receptor Mth2-like [Argiope bruennichi]|uniref:G-protein coupled receptor Mth2-like n=1 Tax=Argiope bruennichi TaxID=94029 RepID=UPI0024956738|nr:G-protein coupled receptor Mth2-like [Argiope bruennichi]XP_055946323.1 G-protein coupled receptor Mth2-like [Argiope bruennichi]
MNSFAVRILVLLAISSLSIGHVLLSKPPIEVSSFMNDTDEDLKKFQYFHSNQNLRQNLNCSGYTVEHNYTLLENGSLHHPEFGIIQDTNRYILENGTLYLCSTESSTEGDKDAIPDLSDEFLACGKVLIDPDEYKVLENGDIHIELYSLTYGRRDYYKVDNGVYICIPQFDEMKQNRSLNETYNKNLNKFSDTFTYVTIIGLLISILSLLSHLIVFCEVSSVRNLPGYCLASLSLSLLMAYTCFLIVALVNTGRNCPALGICIYYFFLTSFFWMNAIAFDVWRSFRVVMRELRISSHRFPWRRFLLYSLYSWTIPAILTILVRVFDSTELLSKDYRPSFGDEFCWFGQRRALMVFFAVPLIVVMILNAVFFLDVTYVISRATLKTSRTHEATLKKRFFMFMKLALIMGLTWIVGLVAGYADNEFVWYLFIIFNTLQGLFIFVVFSCSSKVRGLFCKKYRNHNLKRGSTSVRTISQISANV